MMVRVVPRCRLVTRQRRDLPERVGMSKVVQLGRYASVVTTWTASEIRARRATKGWTQQRLADELGVVRRTVSAWEAGTSPQGRHIGLLEQVLGDTEPEPADPGPLLAEASFPQVLNRMVDLYNDVARASIDRVLRVEDTPPAADAHHDHDTTRIRLDDDDDEPDDADDDTASQSRNSPSE